jgi:hypothetical protein
VKLSAIFLRSVTESHLVLLISYPNCCCAEHSKREDDAVNPVVGVESVVARGGLRLARRVDLCGAGDITTLADICVSGLPGWVAVVSGFERNPLRLRIWAPRGVEVHVRPPMPCPTPVSVAHLEAF